MVYLTTLSRRSFNAIVGDLRGRLPGGYRLFGV